jgi:uncharacterized membrane protein
MSAADKGESEPILWEWRPSSSICGRCWSSWEISAQRKVAVLTLALVLLLLAVLGLVVIVAVLASQVANEAGGDDVVCQVHHNYHFKYYYFDIIIGLVDLIVIKNPALNPEKCY